MKDICQIDANIQTLEQIFPENANSPQDTSSIMLHFNNISVLNNSIFHLLPKLVKLDLSANKLDNWFGGVIYSRHRHDFSFRRRLEEYLYISYRKVF